MEFSICWKSSTIFWAVQKFFASYWIRMGLTMFGRPKYPAEPLVPETLTCYVETAIQKSKKYEFLGIHQMQAGLINAGCR
jgi:hypothetical protein